MILNRRTILLFAFFLAMLVFMTQDILVLNKVTVSSTTILLYQTIDYPIFNRESDYPNISKGLAAVIRLLDMNTTHDTRKKEQDPTAPLPKNAAKPKVVRDKKTTTTNLTTLKPMLFWEEWVRHHSAQVLKQESIEQLRDRKYIRVLFNCPRQAGIATAAYLDGLLLALLTNRTLLVQYGGFWGRIASGENAKEVCFRLVQPAPWIPWLHEFPVRAVFNGTQPASVSALYKGKVAIEKINAGVRVANDASHHRVISLKKSLSYTSGLGGVRPGWGQLTNLGNRYPWEFWNQALGMAIPMDAVIQDLYMYGHYFVYGMLLWNSFPFTEELMASVQEQIKEDNDEYYTIGMHSRHSSKTTSGNEVHREQKCLDTLLGRNHTLPCRLFLMTDRPLTLSKVAAYGKEKYGCESIYIPAYDDAKAANFSSEHGPLAGSPFFQDLAVVSQALDAHMITSRSSSALLGHLIEYRRRLAGKTTDIERCWI